MHDKGITHGDLKPANVLMFSSPDAGAEHKVMKLGDFVKARRDDDVVNDPINWNFRLWSTPKVMSPEAIAYDDLRPPMDTWAFGLLAYELLFRANPWEKICF